MTAYVLGLLPLFAYNIYPGEGRGEEGRGGEGGREVREVDRREGGMRGCKGEEDCKMATKNKEQLAVINIAN